MSSEAELPEQEQEEAEQESVLAPFETPNPWLQKLFSMPAYGTVPTAAIGLLREVSPDPDESLLAAVKTEHGRFRRGYLLATTKWLRWIRTFPTREHDMWDYGNKVEYKGMTLTKALLRLSSGDQFQTWRTRAKPFAQMYGVIQQAMMWEAAHAKQMAAEAVAVSAPAPISLAEELQKLAEMHHRGVLTPEEFAAAKQKLMA